MQVKVSTQRELGLKLWSRLLMIKALALRISDETIPAAERAEDLELLLIAFQRRGQLARQLGLDERPLHEQESLVALMANGVVVKLTVD